VLASIAPPAVILMCRLSSFSRADKKKFGAERTQLMIPQMIERGKADGIQFSYSGKVGNTMSGVCSRLAQFVLLWRGRC
jgi:hypothetical protein